MHRLLTAFGGALIAIFLVSAAATPAIAANPCSVSAQKHALDRQRLAIDRQIHAIDFHYPGPANAAYRSGLKRQLIAEKHQIEWQEHQLDAQRRACQASYHPKHVAHVGPWYAPPQHPKHKHHDHDKDRD